jgi:hypothetical protein
MPYRTLKQNIDIEAVDIPTMSDMQDHDYNEYIESHLLFVDHHGVLRSTQGEYPFACSKSQLQALISYLESVKGKMEQ